MSAVDLLEISARDLIATDPALAREIVRQMTVQRGGLTPRQQDALDFIRSYHAEHGFTPAYSEIAAALDLKSKAGVHRLVEGLVERGYIARIPHRARSILLREAAG